MTRAFTLSSVRPIRAISYKLR